MASIAEKDPHRIAADLRERRRLLDQSAETYLALANRLDDEIAALESAQRLAVSAEDVDFDEFLDRAEREADTG
ncbi:MAG: hypothetical protein ACRDOP_01765 [Gaiellaceae bacterium]